MWSVRCRDTSICTCTGVTKTKRQFYGTLPRNKTGRVFRTHRVRKIKTGHFFRVKKIFAAELASVVRSTVGKGMILHLKLIEVFRSRSPSGDGTSRQSPPGFGRVLSVELVDVCESLRQREAHGFREGEHGEAGEHRDDAHHRVGHPRHLLRLENKVELAS